MACCSKFHHLNAPVDLESQGVEGKGQEMQEIKSLVQKSQFLQLKVASDDHEHHYLHNTRT